VHSEKFAERENGPVDGGFEVGDVMIHGIQCSEPLMEVWDPGTFPWKVFHPPLT
jgi:hypothetical protein